MRHRVPWAMMVSLWPLAIQAAEVVTLNFAPPPLDRFEKELTEIRRKNGLLRPEPSEVAPIRLTLDRGEARPGERWLEGRIAIAPALVESATVEVALYGPGSREPAARASVKPEREEGTFWVDLRTANLRNARLVATLIQGGKQAGVAEALVSAIACPAPLAPQQRIAILLDVPGGVDTAEPVPVTFGLPFAPGSLWDASGLRVVDGSGRQLPHQKEVLARWAKEGAIKWVRFDAIAVPKEGCFVEVAAARHGAEPTLRVAEREGRVTVDTGAAAYVLGKGASPIEEIRIGETRLAASQGTRGLYVVDQKGRIGTASAEDETLEIEARGPIAACVRLEGWYRTAQGEPLARHITRLEFIAGDPAAHIQHTLVLTQDSNEVWFQDIGWELAIRAGDPATAAFAVDRDDGRKIKTTPLSENQSAWLLQDRHFHFAHDTNHFVVGKAGADGKNVTLHEGEQCGDWFAVVGHDAGLGWVCQDAAQQHPKEYEARPDRLVLHLHSSRGGEELDFRMPALVKKWNLKEWYSHTVPVRDLPKLDLFEKRALAIKHNAVGWAKTHALLLVPLTPAGPTETMTRASRLHDHPVFALADPTWTWKTVAAAAMHPKDVQNYPQAEAAIAGTVDWWHARIHEFGEYGFVDYYAGPHLSYRGIYPHEKRYHWATYGLRPGLWRVYLRSGDRVTREFTSRSNQSFMDNSFAHWESARKPRGLFLGANEGGDEPATPATLPLYWQAFGDFQISSSTDLDQLLHDYYLTGNRRARDVVLQFAQGAKRVWTPKLALGDWRSLMMMRTLIQAYAFTWDAELLAMAEATTDVFSDAGGELGLTKERPYHSTSYKTQVDVAAILDAWEITGRPRYYDLALKLARHWWSGLIGQIPLQYMNPQGRIGHFLFAQTKDPSIPEVLAAQIRWAGALHDHGSGQPRREPNASTMHYLFQGIAYSQDVLAQCGAWKQAEASWIGCDDFGYPVSFIVSKKDDEALSLQVGRPTSLSSYGQAGGAFSVRPLAAKNLWGLDLNHVQEGSNGTALVRLPKDAPQGPYEIVPHRQGNHFLVCDAKVPLVLYAPGYWQPAPPQDPAVRYFFQVPQNAGNPQIFFETGARLFDPQGKPYGDGGPCRGWIDLPAGKPGLWSFEATHPGMVRVRNLPPFFAARDSACWFEPPISWKAAAATRPTARPDPQVLYVPGAIALPGNQALQVAGRRTLALEGGPAHAGGDGLQFLPFREGTIEFFYRPNWSTFEVAEKTVSLLSMSTSKSGDSWNLTHYGVKEDAIEWFQSRSLLAMFLTEGASKTRSIRCYRRTIFEKDQWVHVAWVWGRPPGIVGVHSSGDVLVTKVFIDGQPGESSPDPVPGNLPALAPLRFGTGQGFDGAIDELRFSDVMRYTAPFTPPARDREFGMDRHTRALFHFNGNLDGESYQHSGPLPASVK